MKKMTALLLENIDNKAAEILEQAGILIRTETCALNGLELIRACKNADLIGIRSKTQITKSILNACPNLKAVGAFCIGLNQVNLEACQEREVKVFNAPYQNSRSVAELVIGEIIMLMRQVFDKSMKMHEGIWDKSAKGSCEIRGKKLGILGFGNIGTQVAILAEALGMDVYFYDKFDKTPIGRTKKCTNMEDLLSICDVLTVHVDGLTMNKDLLTKKELTLMKKGAVLLNLSRGFVVNNQDLADSIKAGQIGGAAIDVFLEEPEKNGPGFKNPLIGLPNVILTPHIGGSTMEAQREIGIYVAEKLRDFVQN